ncbi:hypothetical protein EUGRSUZ_H04850 [Eucalyptus grandis]|uniref:Uncharacterized protein n=2 Tax=Eucalyptus grandis TaxID=71139 RepID=A0ACC3JZU3_EUCGR|nr:hypothetical protein EUGRSUZ_H04850 [Eucalyptus grandis]
MRVHSNFKSHFFSTIVIKCISLIIRIKLHTYARCNFYVLWYCDTFMSSIFGCIVHLVFITIIIFISEVAIKTNSIHLNEIRRKTKNYMSKTYGYKLKFNNYKYLLIFENKKSRN